MTLFEVLEYDFQGTVLDMARTLGWRRAHFRTARTAKGWRTPIQGDGKGWPDLMLARRPRLIAAELKRGRNRPTVEQDEWLSELAACGVECYVWRPEDLASGRIQEVLRWPTGERPATPTTPGSGTVSSFRGRSSTRRGSTARGPISRRSARP